MIIYKSPREIEKMKKSGEIVATILNELKSQVREGVSTLYLDQLAEKMIEKFKAKPAFKGYKGFKHCVCTSINDEVVHGIPSAKRILKDGDIIGIDFGVIFEGYYGDSAVTVPVGSVDKKILNLLKITEESLWKAIHKVQLGQRLSNVSHAVQSHVEEYGYSVVRDFVGHGIGQALHEDPAIPNFGLPNEGIVMKEGLVVAIEPMINMGDAAVRILDDGWTAVTVDGSLSAHFEHTIALTATGPTVLTHIGDHHA